MHCRHHHRISSSYRPTFTVYNSHPQNVVDFLFGKYITTIFVAILTILGCELIVRMFRGTNFPFGLKRLGEKDE